MGCQQAVTADDRAHMRAALALAARGLGVTWPNPSVGCVIVADGAVVGRGVTAPGGRPHAEAVALAAAGERARGATAYVTLEPCSHWGQTPPCADALVAAGIARVVVALGDPDLRVDGAGLARLRAAGVAVQTGVLEAEAAALQLGFLSVRRLGRPMLTLKLASTLDGRIATAAGESRWITGAAARLAAHRMRGEHDAVLVGIGTALADDPELTCRIPGFRARPLVRVVADGRLRLPVASRLVATAGASPTWVLHRAGAEPSRRRALEAAGVRLIAVGHGEGAADGAGSDNAGDRSWTGGRDRGAPGADVPAGDDGAARGVDLAQALRALARAGLTRVFAEGGAGLAASLLRADLVDRLAWFHAPGVMGADGLPAAEAMGVGVLAAMPRFVREAVVALGPDVLTQLVRERGGD